MSGEGHPRNCPECVRCVECDNAPAWCVSETPMDVACPHFEPICAECWPGACVPCRLEAERELFRTGDYSAAADPLYNHLAPEALDRIARDGGYWWDGRWVEVPDPKAENA